MEVGESKTVHICACRPWNENGIKVLDQQEYKFLLIESDDWNWIDGKVESDPVGGWHGMFYQVIGFPSSFLKRSDKTNWYAFVGTIVKDDKNRFAVFQYYVVPISMQKSGKLYFYANDKYGRYFNKELSSKDDTLIMVAI